MKLIDKSSEIVTVSPIRCTWNLPEQRSKYLITCVLLRRLVKVMKSYDISFLNEEFK